MNRDQYKAELQKLNEQPPSEDLPNQKFPRGCRVKVAEDLGQFMSHFPRGFEAIVEHSYGQQYDTNDGSKYCLIMLEGETPVNTIAWYYEDQLSLLDKDTSKGLAIILDYPPNA